MQFRVPAAREAPLLLCSVCRLWRSTAISTPVLWCSMKIAYRLSSEFIDTWLSRAMSCPLSIAFTLDARPLQVNVLFFRKRSHKHSGVLVPISHRWQSLELSIMPGAPLGLLDDLPKDAVPCLETLIIRYPYGSGMCGKSTLDHIFRSSSNLREVFVFGDDSTVSLSLLWSIPASHLQVLCIDLLLYQEECIGLLSRSPKLEKGFFRLGHFPLPSHLSMPTNPIVLKNLQTLSLHTFTSLTDLFTHVTLPVLRFLRIGFGSVNSWSHEAFLGFISPFSSNLTTLRLDGPPILEEKLIEYLRLLPSVTELGLNDRSKVGLIGNELLSSLTYQGGDVGGSACLCPKLATLELSGVHACTDEHLVYMLESRWRQQTPTRPKIRGDFVSFGPVTHLIVRPLKSRSRNRCMTCQGSHRARLPVSNVSDSVSGAKEQCACRGV